MPKQRFPLRFDDVKARLQELHAEVMLNINVPGKRGEATYLKRQIEAAIECLEFCEKHQIQPDSQVTVLPATKTRTPSSNYRICEDHETNDKRYWEEFKIDGKPFYLDEGDLVIESP